MQLTSFSYIGGGCRKGDSCDGNLHGLDRDGDARRHVAAVVGRCGDGGTSDGYAGDDALAADGGHGGVAACPGEAFVGGVCRGDSGGELQLLPDFHAVRGGTDADRRDGYGGFFRMGIDQGLDAPHAGGNLIGAEGLAELHLAHQTA